MKRFAIMMAVLFVCSSASAAVLYDEGTHGNLTNNLHNLPLDTIGMAGKTVGTDPSNTITAGTHTISGDTAAPNDGDGFSFAPTGNWTMNFSQSGGLQFLWLKSGMDYATGTQVYGDFTGSIANFSYSDAAGGYSIGWYDNFGATWNIEIIVEGEEPPPPSEIPEPAGLGLVGIALLGLRKRRS